ncbi:MFS transporter [Gracilibacillus sp. S3-1-1]|uniref:MFS transporter n=1 Tax=Gracilibacillus pellucidus TaxID=3095368 RepID=A0ACC6M3P4_9BACI|nr:MFS transporter [Gracilibacillus sp. S3-1-1]MDX8045503.1 MFS transporter [Gracilibacillus sp. S3-1-1]
MANFFIFLGFQMTLPTIPLFVQELGGSDQFIGIITGIFTFSALLLRPSAGHALETKGRQFVYMIGLAIFVISIGSYAFITSIVILFIMRCIQGLGWGFSTTATGTIATDLIPESRRGEGMGYFGLSGNLALAIGPALGLTLYGYISFTALFLLCASLGIVAFILSSVIKYKPVDPNAKKVVAPRFDVMEKSALRPSILLFFITFCFGGIASFLPLYTAEEGVAGIQIYFFVYAIFLMVTRTFAGQLYDRKGHIVVFIPGTLLILAAMVLLAWLPNSFVLYLAGALYGLGFGTVQPALQAWAINQSPANRKGMANATFFSFFDLGVGVGAIGFGFVASALGYSYIYVIAAVSIVIAILLYVSLLLKDRKLKQQEAV